MNISDLKFEPSQTLENTEECVLKLKNNYTIRIFKGGQALHTYGAPYELRMSPYSEKIATEPIGYLNEDELIQLISEINGLKPLKSIWLSNFPRWDW